MMIRNLLCSWTVVTILGLNLAHSVDSSMSQSDYLPEEDVIIVTASKVEESLDKVVEPVQVVTEENIRQMGAKTLTEALRSVGGITIKGASPANPTESISMQGFDSDYVKVLIDGIAVSGDLGGSVAVFQIPVEDIERIEVIHGASSALYGSDALGGVINIVTKKTENEYDGVKFHGSLAEEFGYSIYGDLRNYTAATASLAGEKLSGNISGSFDFSPGQRGKVWNALSGGEVEYYETPKRTIGFVRGGINWTDDWGSSLGAHINYSHGYQISNFTAAGFDAGSTMAYLTKRLDGGIKGTYVFDDYLNISGYSSAKAFWLDSTQERVGSVANLNSSDAIDWETEVHTSWQPHEAHQFLFGLNGNLQTIAGDSFQGRKNQFILSGFAQDTITLWEEKLSLVPGLRLDLIPPTEGSSTLFMATPKLSLRLQPLEDTVLKASYGMGYKTATLKQKYWQFAHSYAPGEGNFVLNGNPDLKSEQSQGINLSVEQKFLDFLNLRGSTYFNYLTNMIDSVVIDDTSSPQLRTYKNIDTAITFGAEASTTFEFEDLEASLGYTYTAAKQRQDNQWKDLSLRVNHRVTAGVSYLIPVIETTLRLDGEWNSPQLISSEDNFSPDYLMVSAGLSKSFWEDRIQLSFRVDNLLNNLHFLKGRGGSTQKEYFNLNAGTSFSLGARIII